MIKQIVNNGTLDSCSLNDESSFPDEQDLDEIIETLYDLTSTFYYVIFTTFAKYRHACIYIYIYIYQPIGNYKSTTSLQLSRLESNESIWEDDPTVDDYMLVDDLQKLTDLFVTEANSTLTPKPLWRPFIELLFEDIDTLDLNEKDKILVADLEYLKEIALTLALAEEEELGKLFPQFGGKSTGYSSTRYLLCYYISESYIWWVVVDIVVPHSSDNLKKIWLDYTREVTNVEIGEPRSLLCTSAVNELMGQTDESFTFSRDLSANIERSIFLPL